MSDTYDAIVLGGGPAGSTVAALAASAGLRTLLLERDQFPRCHVGESLAPECHGVFERLGVLERLRQSRYPKKYGVRIVDHTGGQSLPLYFFDVDPRESSQSWQVLRSELDQMLLENAAQRGAECRQGWLAAAVLFDGPRAVGVRAHGRLASSSNGDGDLHDFHAPVIVDATGRQSLLAEQMGLREPLDRLPSASLWSYYRGARRDSGLDAGNTLVYRTSDRGAWFWCIPLPDDITSVGLVGRSEHLLRGRGRPEAVFEEELCKCPAVTERLIDAQLAGEFRVVRDFAYTARQTAGDGWLSVGDAAATLDPLCSSGVFLALKSGELAADAIVAALAAGDVSAQRLACWRPEFDDGVRRLNKLADAFYSPDFSFVEFLARHPQHKPALTELLMGRVFRADCGPLLDDLDPWLTRDPERPAPVPRVESS